MRYADAALRLSAADDMTRLRYRVSRRRATGRPPHARAFRRRCRLLRFGERRVIAAEFSTRARLRSL